MHNPNLDWLFVATLGVAVFLIIAGPSILSWVASFFNRGNVVDDVQERERDHQEYERLLSAHFTRDPDSKDAKNHPDEIRLKELTKKLFETS